VHELAAHSEAAVPWARGNFAPIELQSLEVPFYQQTDAAQRGTLRSVDSLYSGCVAFHDPHFVLSALHSQQWPESSGRHGQQHILPLLGSKLGRRHVDSLGMR